MVITLGVLIAAGFLNSASAPRVTQTAPACLHDKASEAPDQIARRRQALGLARMVNTGESQYAAKNGGAYAAEADLVSANVLKQPAASGEYVTGFRLRLDLMPKGYWFEVVDQTDPCGFRYISNQLGVIFEAQPIR